jgi:hypothetical protein
MDVIVPSAEAMSGNHWCPRGALSMVAASVQVVPPSVEFRTKTFDWPVGSSEAQTTCTPSASAITAEELKNREKVNPLSHANGPSPQSTVPVAPLNWSESNRVIEATWIGAPNETPTVLGPAALRPVPALHRG